MAKITLTLDFPADGKPFVRITGPDAQFELDAVHADRYATMLSNHGDGPIRNVARRIRKQLNAAKPFKCSECSERFGSPEKGLLHKYKVHQTQH